MKEQKETKFCNHCGKEIIKSAEFCNHCGTKQKEKENKEEGKPEDKIETVGKAMTNVGCGITKLVGSLIFIGIIIYIVYIFWQS